MSFGDLNRVNTNVQSMNARFALNQTNSRLSDNQLKLATGLRINKAEDDAAGFSIASQLSGKIGGLEQAARNVGDAKSFLDVAEGGMNSIMDILIQMKSKATQGATGTLGETERGYIKAQIEELGSQIDDVVSATTFQGTELLGGATGGGGGGGGCSTDLSLTFQVGESQADTMDVDIAALNQTDLIDTSTLDETDQATFNGFLDDIDTAIDTLAGAFNQIGIDQDTVSMHESSLAESITANSAARSRIQDADFAKVQSESIKLQIMQQTATAALAQANSSPQAVLGFLQ